MPPTNSLGAAPGKRTINVEVNLLAEWLESRNRLRDDRLRWSGVLASIVILGAAALPFGVQMASAANLRASKAEAAAKARAAAVAALEKERDKAQPGIDSATTLELCNERGRLFVREIMKVLDAATSKMAMESVEAGVLGGDLTIRAKAQAESYPDAQEYVAAAGRGKNVQSAILSAARQSEALGSESISFDLSKKVEVGK